MAQDDSRDRPDAFRSEQRKDKFNKNRPLSQEIFSPTQNNPSSPSQMQLSYPLIQSPPSKPIPLVKSAEDRSAFLRAINRKREKRRERKNSLPRQQSRSPSLDRPHNQNEQSQAYSQTFSQSYMTPGQRSSNSKERQQITGKDSYWFTQNYNSGAERIKSQDRHFNARYTPPRDSHPYRNHSPYRPNYSSTRQRQYSHKRPHYQNDRSVSNDRRTRNNSPYHNSGRNRSTSPYAFPQWRNSSYKRRQFTISEKEPKEILIRVSTQDLQTENR
jgi:hypothetical protein